MSPCRRKCLQSTTRWLTTQCVLKFVNALWMFRTLGRVSHRIHSDITVELLISTIFPRKNRKICMKIHTMQALLSLFFLNEMLETSLSVGKRGLSHCSKKMESSQRTNRNQRSKNPWNMKNNSLMQEAMNSS